MLPAFASARQALCYLAVMLFFVVSPLIAGNPALIPPESRFDTVPSFGMPSPYPFVGRQIYEETDDLDIAIVGSSYLWVGLNAKYIEDSLAAALGRPASVVALGYPFPGYDMVYLLIKGLLTHRRVKTLVVSFPNITSFEDDIHVTLFHLFQPYGNGDFFRGIPFQKKLGLYAAAVLGSPRNWLNLLRRNLTFPTELEATLGSLEMRRGYDESTASFKEFAFTPRSANALIYSSETAGSFDFASDPPGPYATHFLRLIAQACRQFGVHLVTVNIPRIEERWNSKIVEREYWPEFLEMPVDMVGVPPNRLFENLDEENVRLLYYGDHLNANGNRALTPVVTPALISLFRKYETGVRAAMSN
jgi:hypothetical protein